MFRDPMIKRSLAWLLVAFVISVAVRAPLLDRPLSAHHELCTALVLTVLRNWTTDGFATHHGAPAITYGGKADLIPTGYTDAPGLHDGVLYYLSHPPLAYDLPYALFAITGTAPNALGLQLFNLFFHLLTAIALYLVVRELVADSALSNAPLIAAVLYLFMPAPLWFHGNVYMSDMFVQNAWVWHVLVVLRMYGAQRTGWRWPLLAGVTLFITTCISWPGVWAGVLLFVVAAMRFWRSRDRQELRIMIAAFMGVSMALGYTALRWLQVVDVQSLLAYFTGRWEVRGFAGSEQGTGSMLRTMLVNYRTSWLPVLLLMPFVVLRWKSIRSAPLPLFLIIAGVPLLLDHVLLFQYAQHDFTTLKAGVLLCGLAGLCVGTLRNKTAWVVSIALCVVGVLYFYRTNPLRSADDEEFARMEEQGLYIARNAEPDETVFTNGFTPEPQVLWYAKRTLFRVDRAEQARALLQAQGVKKGVIFSIVNGQVVHEPVTALE